MIRKEMTQITDQPTTEDTMQKRQRKKQKETQNTDGNKTANTLPTSPLHKMIEATIFILTMNQQQHNHCIKTANTTRGGYL